jgi:hypothetical protein
MTRTQERIGKNVLNTLLQEHSSRRIQNRRKPLTGRRWSPPDIRTVCSARRTTLP